MALFSKNGSIPKPETDGTEGWITVPDEPAVPSGKEVVWWYPPGWVIRDPKPAQSEEVYHQYDEEGNITSSETKLSEWTWNQSGQRWVAYPVIIPAPVSNTDIATSNTVTVTANNLLQMIPNV